MYNSLAQLQYIPFWSLDVPIFNELNASFHISRYKGKICIDFENNMPLPRFFCSNWSPRNNSFFSIVIVLAICNSDKS